RDGAFGLGVGGGNPRGGPRRPRELIEILVGEARGAAHARAIARKRRGHVLVDRAGRRALGIELGIVLVGLDQGLVHGAGARAVAHQASVAVGLGLAPVGGRLGLPVGGRLGRERRDPEGRRRGYGKRCNPPPSRDGRSPPSPPQHAQTPPPCRTPFAVVPWRVLMANVSHNWAAEPLRPQWK